MTTETNAIMEIQRVCDETSLTVLEKQPLAQRTYALVRGMKQLRELISGEILKDLVSLADTRLGYLTDRGPGNPKGLKPYTDEQIRDVAIEAMIRGAAWVGNEFNVIAGGCYLTVNYFERVLSDLVEQLETTFGPIEMGPGEGLARVTAIADCIFHGRPMKVACERCEQTDTRILVKVNNAMGPDAILGKAKRKLLARVYFRCTGSKWVERETNEPDTSTIEVASKPAPVAPEPETPADGDPPDPMTDAELKAIYGQVCKIELITELQEYQDQLGNLPMIDDDAKRIGRWIKQRGDKIRNERGERSNAKG